MRSCSAPDSRAKSGSTSQSAPACVPAGPGTRRSAARPAGTRARRRRCRGRRVASSSSASRDCFRQRRRLRVLLVQRPVAHLDRVTAPLHVHDRRAVEELGEPRGLDRRRGHDHPQVRPAAHQPLADAEQEIHVQVALVGLVEDQRVVALEQRIALELTQQQPVGHQLHERARARAVGEADLVADEVAGGRADLLRDAMRERLRGDAPRLRVTDHSGHARARARGRSSATACSCRCRSRRSRSRPAMRRWRPRSRRGVRAPAACRRSGSPGPTAGAPRPGRPTRAPGIPAARSRAGRAHDRAARAGRSRPRAGAGRAGGTVRASRAHGPAAPSAGFPFCLLPQLLQFRC